MTSVNKEALQDAQYRVAKDLFLRTADDNYLVARWCRFEQMNVDFSWLAVHALEKYMKAALLMNGHTSKGRSKKERYGHDVVKLYQDVKRKVAQDLLPDSFTEPKEWNRFWRPETPEAYLARLCRLGNADNRYQIFGFELEPEDLVKLDATVFAVRRLCQTLDRSVAPELPAVTNRQILQKQPTWWHVGDRLEQAVRNPDDKMHDVLCHLNLAFATASYEQPRGTSGAAMKRSVLYTEILKYSYPTPEACEQLEALVEWIAENIILPEDVAQELREKVQT